MIKILYVGAGGFIGAILRYLVSSFVQNLTHSISFPYGTLVVNISGCLIIGILSQLVELQTFITAEIRLFLMIGLLGSFTTYATFSNETMNLFMSQRFFLGLMNIVSHVVLGLAGVILGRMAVTFIWR